MGGRVGAGGLVHRRLELVEASGEFDQGGVVLGRGPGQQYLERAARDPQPIRCRVGDLIRVGVETLIAA